MNSEVSLIAEAQNSSDAQYLWNKILDYTGKFLFKIKSFEFDRLSCMCQK
jgi:hypothetical protein